MTPLAHEAQNEASDTRQQIWNLCRDAFDQVSCSDLPPVGYTVSEEIDGRIVSVTIRAKPTPEQVAVALAGDNVEPPPPAPPRTYPWLTDRVTKLEGKVALAFASQRTLTIGPELPDPNNHHCNDMHFLTQTPPGKVGHVGLYALRDEQWVALLEDTTWKHQDEVSRIIALEQQVAKLDERCNRMDAPPQSISMRDDLNGLSNRMDALEQTALNVNASKQKLVSDVKDLGSRIDTLSEELTSDTKAASAELDGLQKLCRQMDNRLCKLTNYIAQVGECVD